MAQRNNTPSADISCRTCSKITKVTFKWTIEDFSLHYKKYSAFNSRESPIFSCGVNDKFKWCLRLHPDKDFFTIILRSLTKNTTREVTQYKLYFVDINNQKKDLLLPMPTVKCKYIFPENEVLVLVRTIEKSLLLKKADVLFPDDILTILCEIVILDDSFDITRKHEPPVQVKTLIPRISDDYQLLFETRSLSDVILTVSGKDIAAHKAVLAARSPVFLAMFEHNMKELKTNRVSINDIDHEVFMEMLRFIYTDKAPNLETMATDLLAAADKYGLERLKAMCTVALYESLNNENATSILALSYLHNVKPLKDLAINFICDQTTDFIATATFKSMVTSHPDLMVDFLCAMNTRMNGMKLVAAEKN